MRQLLIRFLYWLLDRLEARPKMRIIAHLPGGIRAWNGPVGIDLDEGIHDEPAKPALDKR